MKSFIYSWDYALELPALSYPPPSLSGNTHYNVLGNPQTIISAGLLTMSFNDAVIKRAPFTSAEGASSYYFTGNVCSFSFTSRTLMFSIAGTPSRIWPCIIRNGSNIQVTGDEYSNWSGAFGNLNGQLLLNQTLTYGFYLDQENGLLAFKITDGVTELDSGFVRLYPSVTNMLRYGWIVDNTGGESTDRISLTGIMGSYEMTTAELSAVYRTPLSYTSNLSFLSEPTSTLSNLGSSVTFVAIGTLGNCGTQNLQYLWYRGGSLLDVSGSVYNINPVEAEDFASYLVVLTDGVSQVSSSPFTLSPTEFQVTVDKECSPSPGYFRVTDNSQFPSDYSLRVNIRDQETNGSIYSHYWDLDPGGHFDVTLEGNYGDVFRIDLSATYDDVEYG